jgi:hypothetical protein
MSETVTISAERLKELEALEANIPTLLASAVKDYQATKLANLHEKDTQDKMNQRFKKHYSLHKDEINARRREKRRLAKEAAAAAAAAQSPGEGSTDPV